MSCTCHLKHVHKLFFILFCTLLDVTILFQSLFAHCLSLQSCEVDTTLVGHCGNIVGSVFFHDDPSHIITASEDRTFKVGSL